MTETVSINPIYASTLIQKIALYSSSHLGNDIFYLKEFIDLMIPIYGEERVVRMLKADESTNKAVNHRIGLNWHETNGIKRKLKKFDKIIESTKVNYDILEDKMLKKTDNMAYKDFAKKVSQVPLIKEDLYALFVFLIENSSIKSMTIKTEFMKILEKGGRTYGSQLNDRKTLRSYENKSIQ